MADFVGKAAPDFALLDQNEQKHKLSDYRGKKVLLYFYPKDMTPGCTVEAQNFRDHLDELTGLGVVILGVSGDDCARHKKFEEKEGLNFTLLAETEKEVVEKYGVWVEKSMYGKKYMGISRESFLIDEEGVVVKHYQKVKPKEHVDEVIADLEV